MLLSGNALAQLISLAFLPILGRLYGPDAYGFFALFTAATALLSVISTLRYEFAIVLPRDDSDAVHLRRLVSKIVLTSSALVLSAATVFVIIRTDGNSLPPIPILLSAVAVYFACESALRFYWFARQEKFGIQSTGRVVQAIITGGSQLLLAISVLPTTEGLVLGYIAGQAALLVFLWVKDDLRKQAVAKNWRRELQLAYRYRKMPLINGPNALVDAVRINGINFVIAAVSSTAMLGQFSMAWRVAQAPVSLIGSAASQVFFPRLSNAPAGELKKLVAKAVLVTASLGALPFAVLAITAPVLVPWVLGSEWGEVGLYIQALSPWLFLNVTTSPISTIFIVAERQGLLLIFAIVYMAVPLAILWAYGEVLLTAIWITSAGMSAMLLLFLVLALYVSSRHDLRNLASKTSTLGSDPQQAGAL